MPQETDKWARQINRWFHTNPKRQFKFDNLPLTSLKDVAGMGWIAGVASQPFVPLGMAGVKYQAGAKSIRCLVRRADPADGRPLPGVFLMDDTDANAMPPPPPGSEEKLGEFIWSLAQRAQEYKTSFNAMLHCDLRLFGFSLPTKPDAAA